LKDTAGVELSTLKLSQSYKYLENFMELNCFLPFYLIEIIHSAVFIFIGVGWLDFCCCC
jgi:hypothetical protein